MKKIFIPAFCTAFAVLVLLACSKSKNTDNSKNGGGTTITDPPPVIPNTPFKTLKYLYSISGSKTLSGIHNREPNVTPAAWTNQVFTTTGKYPALWSGDFLFQADNINNR